MNNFFKYFPSNDKAAIWGLNVLSVGCTRILPNAIYPESNHPAHHHFTWETGRVLQEYTLIYIVNGNGILETESIKERILDGTIFMVYPNERHRYKPDKETGWDEYWVSFSGDYMDKLIANNSFSKKQPLSHLGLNEKVLQLFGDVLSASKDENSGFQAIIASATIHILGMLYAFNQQGRNNDEGLIEQTVKKAKILFRENLLEITDSKTITNELEVGYSWFRKVFKENTGISPGQYFIQLKIQKAKELLGNPQYAVKEVAYMLKFESPFYFSKLFKQKTGFTPLQFRNMVLTSYK
ncbi:AraC family transcriptional regulator [Pedobacter sp. SD-b]|uniref:AraC family transcriptional regulator n=1 Tax=Pedobacter segetis TaxID=2793069 RepID=A0ABS1BJ42_9SPHI|nr:AraC family transcriptional regulator [Pedobacter segetis]MBK0382897.1 AraC family transcriptional regulator [Pedobacter segetis]